MQFVINTVACHNGGIAAMMATLIKKIKGDKDRVRFSCRARSKA